MKTDNPLIQRWLEPATKTPRMTAAELQAAIENPHYEEAQEKRVLHLPHEQTDAKRKPMFVNLYIGKGDHILPDDSLGDHPNYHPPFNGETSKQATDRRKITPVHWTDHKGPGPLCLGPDFEAKIQAEIQLAMDALESKYSSADFKANASYMRETFENNLAGYASYCTELRAHSSFTFDWQHETIDRVRSAMASPYARPKPRSSKPLKGDELLQTEPAIKPDYQGANHPLEVRQVLRKKNFVGHSKRATSALHQFDQTGRITVPERSLEEWERLHREWNTDIPETSKPVRQAEPLTALVDDVSGPESAHRDYLDIENSYEYSEEEKRAAFHSFMSDRS